MATVEKKMKSSFSVCPQQTNGYADLIRNDLFYNEFEFFECNDLVLLCLSSEIDQVLFIEEVYK